MSRVKITDLVLRDAHQSMLATRMRTEDMLPIASKLDEVGYFSLERNRALIEKLRQAGVQMEMEMEAERPELEEKARPLEGLTFVITGTLPSMSREAAKALIEQHGGKVTGSVSGKTDYLLVGENPGGTKFDRARQLEVPMIDEAELLGMIGNWGQPPRPKAETS